MGSMKDLLGDTPFDAFARTTDPATSHQAAASVSKKTTRLETIVADAIRARPLSGATWDELADLTGLDKGSISPRLKPLRTKGHIESRNDSSGKPIVRRSKMGSDQIVWFPRT